ncbi:hypothetical protein BHM03_00009490 [Ensete ventricosum]|nr:hypothetical protein BHM03_00009490 [Ensete ventricosum]
MCSCDRTITAMKIGREKNERVKEGSDEEKGVTGVGEAADGAAKVPMEGRVGGSLRRSERSLLSLIEEPCLVGLMGKTLLFASVSFYSSIGSPVLDACAKAVIEGRNTVSTRAL